MTWLNKNQQTGKRLDWIEFVIQWIRIRNKSALDELGQQKKMRRLRYVRGHTLRFWQARIEQKIKKQVPWIDLRGTKVNWDSTKTMWHGLVSVNAQTKSRQTWQWLWRMRNSVLNMASGVIAQVCKYSPCHATLNVIGVSLDISSSKAKLAKCSSSSAVIGIFKWCVAVHHVILRFCSAMD